MSDPGPASNAARAAQDLGPAGGGFSIIPRDDDSQPHRQIPSSSPMVLAFRRLRRNRTALLGACVLAALYLVAIFGSFFSPNDPFIGHYDLYAGQPPTIPYFVDETGKFHMRPFVYGYTRTAVDVPGQIAKRESWRIDTTRKYPLRFFGKSWNYKLWWALPAARHLVDVDPQSGGIFLPLGGDAAGRCVWSRLLEGGKISLSIGIIGILISYVIAMTLGGLAGYLGGWADSVTMRVAEFLMSIPTLFLIMAARAWFQQNKLFGIGGDTLSSTQMYVLVIVLLSFIAWAAPARVIRGLVLAEREKDFVGAARAMGASTLRILWRHILPNTTSYVIIAATISVPGYILGEVTLSFLGVGIQEPQVSWGLMLDDVKEITVMQNQPWLLFAPATAIFLTVMAFNFLGDGLRDAFDPKHTK